MTTDYRSSYTQRQLANVFNAIIDRDGALEPEAMHDEFADENHPLHARYEWDDSVAGRAYRINQIQQDVRLVRYEFIDQSTGEVESVRAYSSLKRSGVPDGSGYGETATLVANDDVAAQMMQRRLQRQITSLRKQFGHLRDFTEIVRRELLGEEGVA
jgi:hypothetical protein